MTKKLKDEIKLLNKIITYYEEKLKKISNLGNISFHNSLNMLKPYHLLQHIRKIYIQIFIQVKNQQTNFFK